MKGEKYLYYVVLCASFYLPAQFSISQGLNADSLKNKLASVPDSVKIRILLQLAESFKTKKPVEAMDFAHRALDIAQKGHFLKETVIALREIGMASGFNNDFSTAREYLQKSSALAEEIGDRKTAADNFICISSAFWVQGDYEQQLKYLLSALELYESIGDKKAIMDGKASIGFYYLVAKQYDRALAYLSEAVRLNKKLDLEKDIAPLYVNIGSVYNGKNEFEIAMEYYVLALNLFKKYDLKRGVATTLGAIGETQFKMQQYQSAEMSFRESLKVSRLTNHQVSVTHDLIFLGEILVAQNKSDKALPYLEEALVFSEKEGMKDNLKRINKALSAIYERNGNYVKALEYYKVFTLYSDSLESSEKVKREKELSIKYESEKKEKEIQVLKKEKELSNYYLATVIFGSLGLILLGFLLINRQKLKTSKDRALAEKENQLLEKRRALTEAELLNQRLVEDNLREQLEHKNRELTTYTLNLIQKNEALDKIKESVMELQNVNGEDFASKLNSLKNTINFSLHLDKDWDNFRAYFEQVHRNFFSDLIKICPELSSNDLKLCALIKLNLDTKEVATVMNISPTSAKVARHRLRKKLSLPPEQNLSAFLAHL